MRTYFLFIFLIGISACSNGQKSKQFTDWKENGLFGKVRTMTIYKYYSKSLSQKDSIWSVEKPDEFESKVTYHFDKVGKLDSMVLLYPYKVYGTNKVDSIYNYVLFHYDKAGSQLGYNTLTTERKIHQTADVKWDDSLHYMITNNLVNENGTKSKIEEILITLTPTLRKKSWEYKEFGQVNGVLLTHRVTTNELDEKGYVQKMRVESKSKDMGGWSEVKVNHQKFDAFNNPTENVRLDLPLKYCSGMEVIEYTYYQ